MAAVGSWVRAEARRDWRTWLFLALLIGLFSGAVMASASGARRTESSYHRFLAATDAPDVLLFAAPGGDSQFAAFSLDQVTALPQVAQAGDVAAYSVANPSAVSLIAPRDNQAGTTFFKRKVIAGRLPAPERADEVSVGFMLADALHLGVGDELQLDLAGLDPSSPPTHVDLRIVGIDAVTGGFPPQGGAEGSLQAWTTPAFAAQHTSEFSYDTIAMRLHNGSRDVPAVTTELTDEAQGKLLQLFAVDDQSVNTQRSIHLQAVALWLLAALLAVASVLVLSQLLARQASSHRDDLGELHALGMTWGQLWLVGIVRAAMIGLAGATAAMLLAALASPIFPLGLARDAEPSPGIAIDGRVLALGALCTVLIMVVASMWPSWHAARASTAKARASIERNRTSSIGHTLERAGAPAPVATGVRFALDRGRGRNVTPVRSTIAAAAIGVAAFSGAIVFSASLDHLLATPPLYGVNWDARVTNSAANDISPARDKVVSDPDVSAVAQGYDGVPLKVNDMRVDAIAAEQVRGPSVLPTVLEGRAASGPGEIVLGTATMRELHVRIGDRVTMTVADTSNSVPMTVVGRGVFATLSDALGLGRGASLTISGLTAAIGSDPPPLESVYLRFVPGADAAAVRARLTKALGSAGEFAVTDPADPVDLVNFGRVRSLPTMLGGVLAVLAGLTLAHLLLTSIQRRRRDFAVLKTIGFTPGQMRSAIAWQSSAIAVLALGLGVPLGIVAGRWAWNIVAQQLGVLAQPRTPTATVLIICVSTLVLALVVAAIPAWTAARTRPAETLRAE